MARISRLRSDLASDHTGLVLFDVLNGYLHPQANPAKLTFLKERAILPNLQRLLAGARAAGLTTYYPSGAHRADGSDSVDRLTDTDMDLGAGGNAAAPIRPHFHVGSRDAEIVPELAPLSTAVVIPKQRWSSFCQTNFDLQLRVRGIDTIVIAGGSTDDGIASTVFAARDLDYG